MSLGLSEHIGAVVHFKGLRRIDVCDPLEQLVYVRKTYNCTDTT